MRIALLSLFFTLGLLVSGGAGANGPTDVEKELKKFQGVWTFESVESGGKKLSANLFEKMTVRFEGDKYSVLMGDMVVEVATQKLDPSRSPKAVDSTVTDGPNKDKVYLGIYEIDGDTLKVCFDEAGKKRPTAFKTEVGSAMVLVVHKRVKK